MSSLSVQAYRSRDGSRTAPSSRKWLHFDARLAAKETPGRDNPSNATRLQLTKNGRDATRSGDFVLDKIRVPEGILSDRHRRDAEQMATKVYPLLYAFENSAREFIDGHLTAIYGTRLVGRSEARVEASPRRCRDRPQGRA